MEILKIENLSKTFYLHHNQREIKSCHNINFSLDQGEFIGIIGLSGAGKSTIMKCIHRTYLPTGGNIYYDSEAFGNMNLSTASEREIIYLRKHEIGYVSQFLNIMPRTTAKEHVMNALLEMGEDIQNTEQKSKDILIYFKLPERLWDLYPNTFSGGERLRLNLAHTMVKKPRLMLLDEPTASLDNKTKLLVKEMLKKLKAQKTTMLGIFHDLEFMDGLCDRILNISEGSFDAKS
jgi:alpha-D-ribose 1-methylphosphonate 5-triphosphate synthase subunit PhnL